MRLYIPNGSVASGRFISPRRRRRDGKIPQLRRGWFFRPEAGEGGTADRPGLIFPEGNRQEDIYRSKSYVYFQKSNFYQRRFFAIFIAKYGRNPISHVPHKRKTKKEIKQTWPVEKLGKSFSVVNSDVCNRRQLSLEQLFEIVRILQVNPKDLIESKE